MCSGSFRSEGRRGTTESPPQDFLEIRKGGVVAWVRKGYGFLFDETGMWRTDRAFCPAVRVASPYAGRGEVLRLSLGPMAESCAVVRHYQRGGVLGPVLGDHYLGPERFFQEVRVSEWARSRGVPTTEVLAMRSERRGPFLYRGDLITREIEGSEDMDRYLRAVREQEGSRVSRRKEVMQSVALLLQRTHLAGLYHGDLNLKNIVIQITGRGVASYVIDLDRARVIQPLSPKLRIRNLVRLYRSLDKQGYLEGVVRPEDLLGFVRVYCGRDRELVRACREVMRKERLVLRVHQAGWRLSRVLRRMGGGGDG